MDNGNRRNNSLSKDQCGLLYSTELLLSIILLIFIIGIIANLSDGLNEKLLSEEEFLPLESIAVETSTYLLNNPGNPEIGKMMMAWTMALHHQGLFQALP